MPFFGKKFGSVYLEIFRTIFIHLGKQIAYRYLVYVDGRLIIGDTFIISIIYLYNDSQLGKQIKYVCREADGDTVGIRQFVCRIGFLSLTNLFMIREDISSVRKSLYLRLMFLLSRSKLNFFTFCEA